MRRAIADVAADHLREKNSGAVGKEEDWSLSAASPEDLYEIYDEWAKVTGCREAVSGRSWHEKATAPCRSVMRALAHTKRGKELFEVYGSMRLPGSPICARLRREMR